MVQLHKLIKVLRNLEKFIGSFDKIQQHKNKGTRDGYWRLSYSGQTWRTAKWLTGLQVEKKVMEEKLLVIVFNVMNFKWSLGYRGKTPALQSKSCRWERRGLAWVEIEHHHQGTSFSKKSEVISIRYTHSNIKSYWSFYWSSKQGKILFSKLVIKNSKSRYTPLFQALWESTMSF